MEDQENHQPQTYGHHIARKLNFNAPLLTTRRSPAALTVSAAALSTSDRVPFSWEQAPGKPKDYVHRCDASSDDAAATTPRPTLPPGWWRPPSQTRRNSRHLHRNGNGDGCDDNVDSSDDDNNSDGGSYVLSDVVDVFSLSEAIDHIVEKAEKAHKFSDELKLKQLKYDEEEEERSNIGYNYKQPSNFMMERFLPDATALAASSALKLKLNHPGLSPQRVATRRRPFSPPKGCGLDVLFPWRTKHQLCGVKSPVRHGSRSLESTSSPKQKKQH